jgi:hypothetical protein
MGDLAIELHQSVRGLFKDEKESWYDRLVNKVPVKVQKALLYVYSVIFMSIAAYCMSKGIRYLVSFSGNTDAFIDANGDFKEFSSAKFTLSKWTSGLLLGLSLVMLLYYFHMRRILNRFFSDTLISQKNKINLLYAVFLISYTLRAILAPF